VDAHPDVPAPFLEAEVLVQRPLGVHPSDAPRRPSDGHPVRAYCASDALDDVRPDASADGCPSGHPAIHLVRSVHPDEDAGRSAVRELAIPCADRLRSVHLAVADAVLAVQVPCKPDAVPFAA
jgi:hypothetical protein